MKTNNIMIKIAATVNDLGPSQKSFYLIKEFNRAGTTPVISTSIFYNRAAIPVTRPLFSCSNMSFFSGYHGHAISTTLSEAEVLLKSSNNSTKYLYLWDIDWLNNPVNYGAAINILCDPRLQLMSRSDYHATIIENFCNKKPIAIVDNWNLEQILEVIDGNK